MTPGDSLYPPQPDQVNTPDPLPVVRQAVRQVLLSSPAYLELDPSTRRQMAALMVKVGHTAATLIREEVESDQQVQQTLNQDRHLSAESPPLEQPLAVAQAAGDDFSGVAASRVAGTTRAILNAVSFPRFVAELINGVFKAMTDSTIQQMHSYIELLNNVAASTTGFADANFGPDRARTWLAERYPDSFELVSDSGDDFLSDGFDGTPAAAAPVNRQLRLREGASMPSMEALRVDLGLAEDETIPSGDPEQTLLPFARRHLAQMRQTMLATMVMLGMQRIVIDGGRINASMNFHIDTRSAAQSDEGSRFDFSNQINASGSFGVGLWGASASMQNTIGYVSTQQTQTTEELNTSLDLNSSVELIFRSDQIPLNRLAGADQTSRILANTRNPQAEAQAARQSRGEQAKQVATRDAARRSDVNQRLTPREVKPPAPGSPGTQEAADRARKKAAAQKQPAQKPAAQKPPAQKPAAQKQPAQKQPALKKPTQAKPPTRQAAAKQQSWAQKNGIGPAALAIGQEHLIYEDVRTHEDPANFPINLPESGQGEDQHVFTIPAGLQLSRWEIEVVEQSLGAGYQVSQAPEAGATGEQGVTISWSHLPYGKIIYRLRVYASSDGSAAPATIYVDQPGWFEKARDQVDQGVPFDVGVQGEKARLLYEAIQQHEAQPGTQNLSRSFFAGIDDAVVVAIAGVAIVAIISIVIIIGMVTFALLLKEAMDKGYDISDTRYTVAAGEGETRQEYEMVFNLSRPQE